MIVPRREGGSLRTKKKREEVSQQILELSFLNHLNQREEVFEPLELSFSQILCYFKAIPKSIIIFLKKYKEVVSQHVIDPN